MDLRKINLKKVEFKEIFILLMIVLFLFFFFRSKTNKINSPIYCPGLITSFYVSKVHSSSTVRHKFAYENYSTTGYINNSGKREGFTKVLLEIDRNDPTRVNILSKYIFKSYPDITLDTFFLTIPYELLRDTIEK